MSLTQRMKLRVRRNQVLNGIASEVAERSFAPTWEKVHGEATMMERHEQRGYVRVHAAVEVERTLENTVRPRHLPEIWHERLANLAIERLVDQVVSQLRQSDSAMPLRRAA